MAKKHTDYVLHPKSVKHAANEIKAVVDDYWNRILPMTELKLYLQQLADQGKLFKAEDFNPTIRQIIGKKRMEIVETMLAGYQQRIEQEESKNG